MKMSCDEVVFHPTSFADPNGRLFFWSGQLYRAICVERASLYQNLFNDGTVQELIEKKLVVETEPSSLQLDGYGMVMKHKTIPFISYPYEWCTAMFKDAALLVLDLEVQLAQRDLTLQDAHPWNVLYNGPIPLHVDFGSIVPAARELVWGAHNEFCRFFLHPLLLMAKGHGRIARWLLYDYGIPDSDLAGLIGCLGSPFTLKNAYRYAKSIARQLIPASYRSRLNETVTVAKSTWRGFRDYPPSRVVYLGRLRREIESIPIPQPRTAWSDYYDDCFPPLSPSGEWNPKHSSVFQALSEIRPKSVLDIGSNKGWYSQLAAVAGSQVVALDIDETCITQLYYHAKEKKLSILPLVMDFRNPSPGYGLCNQSFAPATDRLRCDMVIALALAHHLVFKEMLNFDQILHGLSVFSKRWVLVEFIPADDEYVRQWWSEKFSWYTFDNFVAAVKKRFQNVRILRSHPKPRVLVLGEKT